MRTRRYGLVAAFALGEVAVHDGDRVAVRVGEGAPDKATLGVLFVTGEAFVHAQGFLARQQRHPVVAFLPMVVHVIAKGLHFGQRELVIVDFGFLQTDHVGLVLFNQRRQLMRAGAQPVDIEGDDFHGRQSSLAKGRC